VLFLPLVGVDVGEALPVVVDVVGDAQGVERDPARSDLLEERLGRDRLGDRRAVDELVLLAGRLPGAVGRLAVDVPAPSAVLDPKSLWVCDAADHVSFSR
jgi:hypothetical protein